MRINMLGRLTAVLTVAALAATGCEGVSTRPTAVTATSATLHAQTSCRAETTSNPCTYWFQYWADGGTIVSSTPKIVANVQTNGPVDVQQEINGLSPGTLYHAQFCGYGDTNVAAPGLCVGLPGGAVSAPGSKPDAGDFNATQRFRTSSAGTRATAELGRPLSTADTGTNPISRDVGLSVAYSATHSLWLFGDTVQRNGPAFIAGATAAAGPYTRGQVPTALQELPTPPTAPTPGRTAPARFLPTPQGLLTPDNPPVACGLDRSYPASWISGAARIPGTSRVLIVYAEVCVAIDRDWPTGRLTLAEYNPANNTFTSVRTPFTAAPIQAGIPVQQRLGSPVFGNDGYLYLYGHDRDANQVIVARVAANATAWGSAASYRWWGRPGGAAAQWTSDQTAVTSVVGITQPWSVHVADYTGAGAHRLGMLIQTSFGSGRYQLFTADSPTGPWTAGPAGQVPDTCVGGFGCYAFHGHPELSTADQFIFSWYSPGDRSGFGHIRLGTIDW